MAQTQPDKLDNVELRNVRHQHRQQYATKPKLIAFSLAGLPLVGRT